MAESTPPKRIRLEGGPSGSLVSPRSANRAVLDNTNRMAKWGAAAVPKKAVFIAVWNYKGGVMKTTTTRELASTLALQGYKVGMVDADYQCNLTSFFLDEGMRAAVEVEEEKMV